MERYDPLLCFGYKQTWLAFWNQDPGTISRQLSLTHIEQIGWREGIARSYDSGYDHKTQTGRPWAEIFVSAAVKEWTLAIGGIGTLPDACSPEWLEFLCKLSRELGQVQSFGTHRVSDYVAFARADNGRIIRAYGYSDSNTLVDIGDPTLEELEIGFNFLNIIHATSAEVRDHEAKVEAELNRQSLLRDKFLAIKDRTGEWIDEIDESWDNPSFDSRFHLLIPDEESVMLLANRWSINPMKLYDLVEGSEMGLIGRLPRRTF